MSRKQESIDFQELTRRRNDPLAIYLLEMARYPLLSREEEIQYSRAYRKSTHNLALVIARTGFGAHTLLTKAKECVESQDHFYIGSFPIFFGKGENRQKKQRSYTYAREKLVHFLESHEKEIEKKLTAAQEAVKRVMSSQETQKTLAQKIQQYYEDISKTLIKLEPENNIIENIYTKLIRYRKILESEELPEEIDRKDLFIALRDTPEHFFEKTSEAEEFYKLRKNAESYLFNGNWRLVVSIATKFTNRGVSLPDLIQEGNRGILRAIEKYDPDKGFKFGTYATGWIMQGIVRAISEQKNIVRIPEGIQKEARKIHDLEIRFNDKLTEEEIIDEIPGMSIETLRSLRRRTSLGLSDNVLEDEKTENPELFAQEEERREKINEVLRTLPIREREILEARFALNGQEHQTLNEIGKKYKVTRARIGQIEIRALEKIRETESRRKKLENL